MSDLQLALLAIGVAVIAGVVAYNKWQEIQLRRKSEETFGSRHTDVLLEPPAPTPAATDPASHPAESAAAAPDRDIEHTLGAPVVAAPESERPAPPAPPAPAAAVLDTAIDYVVELRCARPVEGAVLAEHAHALVDEGLVKPVYWEGTDTTRATWRPIAPEGRYDSIRVGLQLTNRAGPISEDDLLAFCGAVQEVALAIAAEPDFPDTDQAVQQAQALDRFCAEVDVELGLSVIGSEAHTFTGSKIRAAAESAGLALGRDGRFHRRAEDGAELFALANVEPMPFHAETMKTLQTRGVSVLFDVPRVPAGISPFRRYIEFAHQLEHALGGMLVDDDKKPIGQAALEAISQQLEGIHRTMSARGIPAGSALALRLFS
jgi:hypothetical protein